MGNKKNLESFTDAEQLIDALLGFDHRAFQHQMTDGLDEWLRRRKESAGEMRLYLQSLAVVLLMSIPTHLLAGTDNYRLSGEMTYTEAIAETNALLGL